MQEKDQKTIEHALRNLRHLYEQMVAGLIKDQISAAKYLLSPAIQILEKFKDKS